MNKTALIIGASGGIGGETVRALLARGFAVRAIHRDPARAAKQFASLGAVEWLQGDAMKPGDVLKAAQGVSLLVHAANPPGYRNWQSLVLPMLESSIAAAKAVGARLVLPGTVYNYGPDALPVISESSPQRPTTRKGAIRVAMERRLEQASREGTRVLIVRAGDFFGPVAGNNWFSQAFVKPGKPIRAVTYPGKRDVGHAWAYLPDLAQAIARLAERDADLATFEVFNFGGHWFERGVALAEATCSAADLPKPRIRRFPWFMIYLLAPFIVTFREMLEMRYLWSTSLRLDNRKLVSFLGAEPHTELDAALRATLHGLGCAALGQG